MHLVIRLAAVRFPNLPNPVQTRFGTGVQGSGSAEYLNPNLLAGSGSSKGRTQTWGSNLEPQNVLLEIDEPTRMTRGDLDSDIRIAWYGIDGAKKGNSVK